MDSNTQDSSKMDESNNGRKFGLPEWMVHNIERLNTVTDFEQYACSPPESEGFLSEYVSGPECQDNSETFREKEQNSFQETFTDSEKSKSSKMFIPEESKLSPSSPYHSILDAIKHDDYYSSPDTTPCATPQPSPAPRRKISGQQDSIQSNPGRWFYLGNTKRSPRHLAKGQCFNVNSNKENHVSTDKRDSSDRQTKDSSENQGFKLVISNFEINAISPTSW